jgi:hypothetical protein
MRDIRPETDQPPASPPRPPVDRPPADRPSRQSTATAQVAEQVTETRTIDWWRVLRLVFAIQGLYYAITGLWPLLARVLPLPHLFSATSLGTDFASTLILGLTSLLGLIFLATVTRRRPDGLLVCLGAGSALVFFLTGLLFREVLGGRVFLALIPELLFLVAMIFVYLAAIIRDRRQRS